jgi:hypothetical protein
LEKESPGEMASSHCRECAIHFEGKNVGELKSFTQETLAKVKDVQVQWLSLPEPYKKFSDVAKDSLKLIDDNQVLQLQEINEACGCHLHCYRTFTDISKLARAKKTITNPASTSG